MRQTVPLYCLMASDWPTAICFELHSKKHLPWCAKQVQAIWLGFNVDRDIFEKEKWSILKHIHALVDLSLGACK